MIWLTLGACVTLLGCERGAIEQPRPPTSKRVREREPQRRPLTFGVVPQQSASKLARLWTPILSELGERLGQPMIFRTAKDIPSFEARCAAGDYDVVYMNPYHYTHFHDSVGYRAVAKQEGKRIQGIIVTRKDSELANLAELGGMTLAFPAPAAFAASILPRAGLDELGVSYTSKYVSSHDSVYRSVAKGIYPAGGGIVRTLRNVDPAVRDQLRVLWRTPKYTPHAFAVHPRIEADRRASIRRALVELTKGAAELLEAIKFDGIEAANDRDWDDIRKLGLDQLEALKKG